MTPLPALYANEFSPVLVPQMEQLSWTSQVQQPQPVAALAPSVGGGLLKHYADTDALPRRIRLRPINMVSEVQTASTGSWPGPLPETPMTLVTPVDPVQQKVSELVGAEVRPMGLLSRYAMEKNNGRE